MTWVQPVDSKVCRWIRNAFLNRGLCSSNICRRRKKGCRGSIDEDWLKRRVYAFSLSLCLLRRLLSA